MILRIADVIPKCDRRLAVESGTPAASSVPYSVYNICHGSLWANVMC